jgi:hypothetical protein
VAVVTVVVQENQRGCAVRPLSELPELEEPPPDAEEPLPEDELPPPDCVAPEEVIAPRVADDPRDELPLPLSDLVVAVASRVRTRV